MTIKISTETSSVWENAPTKSKLARIARDKLASVVFALVASIRGSARKLSLGLSIVLLLGLTCASASAQQSQTINFAALSNVANGVAPFTVSATASSGLPVSFVSTSPTVCTVSGSTVTVIAGGTCYIVAQQPGNASYIEAPDVEQSFIVLPGSQTISFAPLANQLTSTAPFTLSATASSGLPVSFTSGSKSVCIVSASSPIVALVAPGTCIINASQAGDNISYAAAPTVTQTFVVAAGTQTISFPAIPSRAYSDTYFVPPATASSGLTVTLTSSTPSVCQVGGADELFIAGGGTCTITANQVGNSTYLPAPPVTQSFTITPIGQTISFPIPSSPFVAALQSSTVLTAIATSNLQVAFTSQTPSVCSLSNPNDTDLGTGSTAELLSEISATFLSPGTCTITANQLGNSSYTAAPQVTQSFTYQASQTINFAALPNLIYGAAPFTVNATASSGLPVNFSSSTPTACTISGSTVTIVGTGPCVITAAQSGNGSYAAAIQVAQEFTVALASQTISFASPANQLMSASPVTLSAVASSGLPVTFTSNTASVCTVSGITVTLVSPGTCTLNASQAGNANYSAATVVSQSFDVGTGAQTITFPTIATQAYGNAAFALSATASSGLAVSFTSSTTSACRVGGGTELYIEGGGICTITANQAGNSTYLPAPSVSQSFTILPISQSISFPAPTNPYVAPPQTAFWLTASTSSSWPVTFSSSTPAVCTLSNQGPVSGTSVTQVYVTLVSPGVCTITATQPGSNDYTAAAPVTQSFTYLQPQTISASAATNLPYGSPPFIYVATATSGLPVTFTSQTPAVCAVTGNATINLVGEGSCYLLLDQAGNSSYGPAPEIGESFSVTAEGQTINFAALPNQLLSASPITVSATASSNLPVTFTSSTTSVCTVSGTTAALVADGTCTINAQQVGNHIYSAAPTVTQSFTVGSASQSISFTTIPTQTYNPNGNYQSLSASSSSTNAVGFASNTPSVCSVVGSLYLVVGAGTCSITANQAGNAAYLPAPPVTQSFTVLPASQTISFADPATNPYFAALGTTFSARATTPSNLQVTFASLTPSVCTISNTTNSAFGSGSSYEVVSLSTVTVIAPGTCTITANQAGNNNYTAAPQVTQSFNYLQSQTIDFPNWGTVAVGTPPFIMPATASSGLPVSFTSSSTSICTVSGSAVTVLQAGLCTILANQAGNSYYGPAPQASMSFNVTWGSQTINFAPLPNVTYGTAPFAVSAMASSGLPVAFTSSTTSVCTVAGSTVTLTGVGTCTIAANQAGVTYQFYPAPQVTQSFTVSDSGQTITFAPLPTQLMGTAPFALSASSSSNLALTFSSSTPSVCTVSGSTVTLVAPGTCSINANQAGNIDYTAATQVTQSFAVMTGQTINFIALPTPYTGNLQATVTLNATASSSLPVTFTSATPSICTVSGNAATVVAVGTCTIDANQTGNAIYTAAPQVAQSFVVSALSQSIGFAALTNQTIGVAPFTISATASSKLPVVFSSATTSTCTVSGNTVTVVAVGTCTINANQVGNPTYAAAPQVAQSFNITLISQSISFASLTNQIYGVAPITLSATATSSLPVVFTSSTPSVCTVLGNTLTILTGGTCTIDANQAGDGVTYAAAAQVAQSFTVADASQAITFGALANQTYGVAPITLSATSSVNLPVVFSSTTPTVCTVSGNTLTVVGAGTCSINADQPGNSDYSAATTVTQAFTVTAASQTITFGALGNKTYGAVPITLTATSSSNLSVVFSSTTQSVCTVSGTTLTIVGAGTCSINADQPGNSGYNAAVTVTQAFTVVPSNQAITFGSLSNQTYGVAPITLAATASSNLQVVYSSTTPTICTVANSTLTVIAGGLCSINADQPGNGSYTPAATMTQSFIIADASQTISFPAIPAQNMGEAPFALNATSSANLPITYSTSTPAVCAVSGQMVIINAMGTCTVTASQIGNNDFNSATAVTQSFNVLGSAAQTSTSLSVGLNPIQTLGRDPLTATVTGNNPTGTVTFMNGTGVLGTAAVASGQASFTPSFDSPGVQNITAVYSGDANNPASTSTPLALNVIYSWVNLTSPNGGDVYNGPANVFMRVQAIGTIGTVSASFWVNGKTYPATPDSSGGYYANVSLPVSSTPYEIFGIVTDNGGSESRETEIANITVVASGAELTIGTPTVSGTTINMSATATQVAGATVEFLFTPQSSNSPSFLQQLTGPGTSNTATNNNGTWSYAWTNVPAGTYTISAQLVSSTGTVLGQQTAPGTITIGGPASGTTLSASTSSITTGKNLGLTAIVYGSNPTGTVTFMDNGTSLGSSAVAYGSAMLTTSLSTVGANNLTAVYSGDSKNVSTTSPAITVQGVAPVLLPQTITFPTVPNQVVGAAPITLNATSSAGLPVSFTYALTWQCNSAGQQCYVVPGPCSVSGNTLTILSVGTCQIEAYNSGNATYAPQSSGWLSITIGATMPTVTMTAPTNGATFVAPYDAFANATASVPVAGSATAGQGTTIATTGVLIDGNVFGGMAAGATVGGTVAVPVGTHTIQIQATDAAGNTNTSPPVTITVTEGSGAQTISFAPIPAQVLGEAPFTVAATSTSNLPVTLTSNTPAICTVSQGTVTVLALGTCTITASQNGNASFTPATQVQQSFVVTNSSSGGNTGGGGTGTTPTVTLTAIGNNVRVASGATAQVTFNGGATETSAQITGLTLYQSIDGSTWTQAWTGTGANIAYVLSLTAGSYQFKLTATDSNNNTATSAPLVVNITSSVLQGLVNGIEDTTAGTPQLFGWVCQSGNSTGLNYEVYVNAPTAALGGTQIATGTANVSGQADDTIVQQSCGTTGSSHDFTVDLSGFTSQYGGAPIYVQAQDANGDTIVLPCSDNNCTMPGSMRIGLTTPSPTNTDQYVAPATAFLRALVTNGTATGATISFAVKGTNRFSPQYLPATADTVPGAYYASLAGLGPGVYTATAEIQQGDVTLYSMPNTFTVISNTAYSLVLNDPGSTTQTAPVSFDATVEGTMANGITVQFYANDQAIGSPVTPDGSNLASYTWNTPTPGTYGIYAKLLSGSGTLLAQSNPATVTIAATSTTPLIPLGAAAAPITIAPPYLGNPDAGTLPGNVSVGNNGAATYSIPIAVPPGTAGLVPTLSLNYSSLAGNGIAGFGWSLGGGSSIHRCVRTVAQDGFAGPINLNNTDALCLDGVRLLPVTGTYGQNGTTYRTEIDNFARITDIGSNGVSQFKVETKDGKVMLYGTTPTSAVQIVGKKNQDGTASTNRSVLFWDLARVTDLAGNQINYTYSQDPTTGEHLLQTITYGAGNNNQYASVQFGYECRNGAPATSNCVVPNTPNTPGVGDADIEYVAGARVDLRHRLKTISTFTTNAAMAQVAVQTTTLGYANSTTSQRSLLTDIHVCAANGACLPQTTFTWGTPSSTSTNAFVPQGLMSNGPPQNWVGGQQVLPTADSESSSGVDYQQMIGALVTGDFYGDGKQRILTADQGEGPLGGSPGLHIYTVNATGSGFETPLFIPFNGVTGSPPSQLDFGVPNMKPNNGTVISTIPTVAYQPSVIVGDFDGDGKADFAYVDSGTQQNGIVAGSGNIYICLSRLTASGGTFDCQAFPMVVTTPTVVQACNANGTLLACSPQTGHFPPYQAMFLGTQANGRADMLIWNSLDPSSNSNQRCSYVAPSGGGRWSWSCINYPGTMQAQNMAMSQSPFNYDAGAWGLWPVLPPTSSAPPPPFQQQATNNSLASATAQRSYMGDFLGTGQASFIAQYNLFTVPANGIGQTFSNSVMMAAVASNSVTATHGTPTTAENNASVYNTGGYAYLAGFNNASMAYPMSPTPVPTNQFVWSNSAVPTAGNVTLPIERYLVRESRGTEIGGTSLGDLNGDGYTDYLMTFEGHSEVCYSNGIDGFNCVLMEELTPTTWTPPNLTFPALSGTWNNVSIGLSLASDHTTGLLAPSSSAPGVGVFSVLSVGHADDSNMSEVIYRRTDGNGTAANQYWVCSVRDGMKNCTAWTGPTLPQRISGATVQGYPIPGISFIPAAGGINWPTSGSLTGDFTGHGRTEILWYCNSNCTQPGVSGAGWQLYTPNVSGPIDRLVSVKNGVDNITSIDYKPMSDTTIYTQQPTDGTSVGYPLVSKIDGGRMLVSALHNDRGDHNLQTLTTSYTYEGLATDNTGRGEQGFERVNITNPLGTVHSTQYAQGFPFTGMELTHKVTASSQNNNNILEQSAVPNTLVALSDTFSGSTTPAMSFGAYPSYVPVTGYDTAVHPFVQSAQVNHYDLNGTAVSQTTSTIPGSLSAGYAMDAWGDVTQQTVTVTSLSSSQSAPYVTTTNNTPLVMLSPYVIGPPIYTSVTKSAPGQANITRAKQFDYYGQSQSKVCSLTAVSNLSSAAGLLQDEISECYPTTGVNAALSVQTSYIRDSYGNIAQTVQNWKDPVTNTAMQRNTATQYDTGFGRFPVTTVNVLGQFEQHGYDAGTGAKTSLTDINNLKTTWSIDGFGRVTAENRVDGTTTNLYRKLCNLGCPSTTVDYAAVGAVGMIADVVTIKDHVLTNSPTTRIAVPELDYVDFAGHALRKQSYGFDGTEIDTDASYDQYGRPVTSFQAAYANNTALMAERKQYDELNRVTQISTYDDGGNIVNTGIAYDGLVVTVTNPENQTKTTVNDVLGQLVLTIDAAKNPTYFTRDAFGNLLQTKDQPGNLVSIGYDNLGRKTSMQDPDLGTINYSIDPLGREYKETNPNESAAGVATTFIHDCADRLIQRTEPALGSALGLSSNWIYDNPVSTAPTTPATAASCLVNVPSATIPALPTCAGTASCGKLVEAYTLFGNQANYNRTQSYDNIGRPSNTQISVYGGTYSNTTGYDAYDRVSSIVDLWTPSTGTPLTKTFAQYYNNTGYLAQVARITGSSSNPVAQVLWQASSQDAEDRVLQAQLGNGLSVKRNYYPYSERLQDTNLTNPAAGNSNLLQEGYQYDVLGNVQIRTEYWNGGQSGFSETFRYDPMNRLYTSQVTSNSKTSLQTFTYDAIGDIVSKTGVGTGNYNYPAPGPGVQRPHAVLSITGQPGNFQYDANGNMMSDPYGRSTTWNSFDMPYQITMSANGSTASSQFAYGPEHQRTRQNRGDGSMIVYAGSMEIVTPNNGGASTIKTYWPDGLGVEIDAPNASTTLNWTHTDNLGSVVAVTGSTGNLEESMAYDPWGARRDLKGDAGQLQNYAEIVDNKGFTDQEMLDQLNLVHLNGRVYDPLLGRFISADPEIQDPTHSQSYNRYAYVWNNPTNNTDPSGFVKDPASGCLTCDWTVVYQAPPPDSGGSAGNEGGSAADAGVANAQGNTSNATQSTPSAVGTTGGSGGNGGSGAGNVNHVASGGAVQQGTDDGPATYTIPIYPPADWHRSGTTLRPLLQLPSIGQEFGGFGFGGLIGIYNNLSDMSELLPGGSALRAYNRMWGLPDHITPKGSTQAMGASTFSNALMFMGGPEFGEDGLLSEATEDAFALEKPPCSCCFAGNTSVAVKSGTMPIEQVKIGQLVYSRDPETGNVQLKPVTDVMVVHGKPLYALVIEDAKHVQSRTEVTDNHPYWIRDRGWVESAKLEPGMVLESLHHGLLKVVSVTLLNKVQTTYNLTVADYHTFFAGEQLVYVHNQCACQGHHAAKTITFTEKQLQKKFASHAADFGVDRTWGKGAAEEFQSALSAHVADPATNAISGTYRGTQDVTHFFNPNTGLNVMRDADGAFLSGWKLGPEQIENLLTHGNIQ